MSSLFPQTEGYLPYFLLYTSVSALIHSLVCYLSAPSASLRQFSGPEAPAPTPLLAHVYGVKNVYTGLIRFYAAYNLDNLQLYDLALLTFIGVLALYVSELVLFRTVRLKEGMFPFVTAGAGLVWMVLQRRQYE